MRLKFANKVFKAVFTALICAAVFFFAAVGFMSAEMSKTEKTSEKVESEPYESLPLNSGIFFKFENGENILIYLDFEKKYVSAVFTENQNPTRIGKFTVDYTVSADYTLIAGIIDRLGGIELRSDNGVMRYTGMQAMEFLSSEADAKEIKIDILKEIFKKISQNGFSKDDFVYIIKQGGTDMLVPDCFFWEKYMSLISQNLEVIA